MYLTFSLDLITKGWSNRMKSSNSVHFLSFWKMEYLAESAMMTGNENITLTKFAAGSKILHV